MAKSKKPDFGRIDEEMDDLRGSLDALPDDENWTDDELDKLDDVRTSANRLAREIEATIETYEARINNEEE